MKNAIKRAIEGGYKPELFRERKFIRTSRRKYQYMQTASASMSYSDILLDPLFWQALGKSLGWEEETEYEVKDIYNTYETFKRKTWLYNWHRFIDHLAGGGNAEEFFEKLIK